MESTKVALLAIALRVKVPSTLNPDPLGVELLLPLTGVLPSVVYQRVAPDVALVIVTVCGVLYVSVLSVKTGGSARSALSALSILMRFFTMLLRLSVIARPVDWSTARPSVTVIVGFLLLSTAQAPATCGAAIEVPANAAYAPLGTDEVIAVPGASSDRKLALSE